MRDVSKKTTTLRVAVAEAQVSMRAETIALIHDGKLPKGDPFPVAKVAAIQAAKQTSNLIPYCHSLPIDFADATFTIDADRILIRTEVKAVWKTGVEMEALTAASIAALTIYDMVKMVDDSAAILEIRLVSKRGGKSDLPMAGGKYSVAVLVLSDSVFEGKAEDTSGKYIQERLMDAGLTIAECATLPDHVEVIAQKLRGYAEETMVDLVITTGSTGLGPRDVAPEAMHLLAGRSLDGISTTIRNYGQQLTPYAMLSRAEAVQVGNTIIINLPGSRRAVEESLDAILPQLFHAFKMIAGGDHASDHRMISQTKLDESD
jgi:molybdenum cofactor biosynthesis protein MoaC